MELAPRHDYVPIQRRKMMMMLVMRLVMMTCWNVLTSPLLQLSLLDVFEFSFQ